MEIALFVLLAALAGAFVTRPFWHRDPVAATEDPEVAALEAARDAKYREIKDAEVDLASGKLNQDDFERVNAELRADAVRLLDDLEQAKQRTGGGNG